MSNCPVYMIKEEPFTHSEVLQILENPGSKNISTVPARKPEHGQVYVYSYKDKPEAYKNWRADRCQWKHKGIQRLPKKDPVLGKIYHQLTVNGETVNFHRYGYEHKDPTIKFVVVHYLGNKDTVLKKGVYGVKPQSPKRIDMETLSSVYSYEPTPMEETQSDINKAPIAETTTTNDYVTVQVPGDAEETSNKPINENRKRKLKCDELRNVYELHLTLDNFITNLSLVPEFSVVLALPEIVEIFNSLTSIESKAVLYYDTSAQFGDFYVSTLILLYSIFEERPCIPLAGLIHKTKNQKVHQCFFDSVKDTIPTINTPGVTIVTAREPGVAQAIEESVPNAKQVFCWNDLLKEVEDWVTKHETSEADQNLYINDVLILLKCDSALDYETSLYPLKSKWSNQFMTHFDSKLKIDIKNSGKWVLEELGIYKSGGVVTTSVSDGLNIILKRMIQWEVVSLENMVLAFYFLQTFYQQEIIQGYCNTGYYRLKEELKSLKVEASAITLPADYMSLQALINLFKSDATNARETENKPLVVMQRLAEWIVAQNRVYLESQSAKFSVKGLRNKDFVVSLFPEEKCSCNSTQSCYHIMASRLAVGL
ncbi:uncharacterized protein LOC128474818 [Spea bombifrons]|uniref:uncharacterized protein LOC128474818 n=1 Tax=Spea bombifrons TaxID=233779 RepID=UPI00234BD22E|nr:uncharacterized protein LOC128474818 [Spea bombifrons]